MKREQSTLRIKTHTGQVDFIVTAPVVGPFTIHRRLVADVAPDKVRLLGTFSLSKKRDYVISHRLTGFSVNGCRHTYTRECDAIFAARRLNALGLDWCFQNPKDALSLGKEVYATLDLADLEIKAAKEGHGCTP